MASLSELGQNPYNRDGFFTAVLHFVAVFAWSWTARSDPHTLYSLISLYCTTDASWFLFSVLQLSIHLNRQQQGSNRWLVKEIYSCHGHTWPLCSGCVHRDSFCVKQLPLLAQIPLKLAGLINYSPGINNKGDMVWSPPWGFSAWGWAQSSNKLMDAQSNTPREQLWQSLLQLPLQ